VEGIKEVKVMTAFPLKDTDRSGLLKKINKLIGKNMQLKEVVDPKIVAGISIEIGSLVLDGSLRNKIQEKSSMLAAAERGSNER
jgi:F0F1-type ATP synthase delta subunit